MHCILDVQHVKGILALTIQHEVQVVGEGKLPIVDTW